MTGPRPPIASTTPGRASRLAIAPSTMDLSGLELELGHTRDRAFRLRNAINSVNAGKSIGAGDFSSKAVVTPDCKRVVKIELTGEE